MASSSYGHVFSRPKGVPRVSAHGNFHCSKFILSENFCVWKHFLAITIGSLSLEIGLFQTEKISFVSPLPSNVGYIVLGMLLLSSFCNKKLPSHINIQSTLALRRKIAFKWLNQLRWTNMIDCPNYGYKGIGSSSPRNFQFPKFFLLLDDTIGPLQLAIHVVQNRHAGEQKSH